MKTLPLMVTAVLFSILLAHGDVLIRQQTRTPAMMGRPAQTETSELWLGNGVMATVGKRNSTLLDLNAKKMFMIDHEAKTYVENDLPFDPVKMMPPEAAAQMAEMLKNMTVTVEKTAATKQVAGIDTVAYKVTVNMMAMAMTSTYWVAEKGLPFDWKNFQKLSSQMAQVMMRGGEQVIKEFSKIEGFPLATEVAVMGVVISSETTELNGQAKPPAGTYAVPAGYTKTTGMGHK